MIDLIGYLEGLAWHSKIDAYWWALDFLRLERGTIRKASEDEAERRSRQREQAAHLAREQAKVAEKRAGLFKDWLLLSQIEGTAAWTYLETARAIPLDPSGAAAAGAAASRPALDHVDPGDRRDHPLAVHGRGDDPGQAARRRASDLARARRLGQGPGQAGAQDAAGKRARRGDPASPAGRPAMNLAQRGPGPEPVSRGRWRSARGSRPPPDRRRRPAGLFACGRPDR